MLFSATLDGQVQGLITRYLKDPIRHEVESDGDIADEQTHRFLAVHRLDKPKVAARIIRSVKRTLVFVSTRHGADRVAEDLRKEGIDAHAIHGDLRQSDRERRLADFTEGRLSARRHKPGIARSRHLRRRRRAALRTPAGLQGVHPPLGTHRTPESPASS